MPTLVGRDSRPNCLPKKELRRYEPRSRFPQKIAFSTPFQGVLPPSGPRIIAEGWQGVLRHAVLEAMPVSELAENFSRELGAPTKGAEGATHFLAPGKRGWPLSTPCPLFSRHSPLPPVVDRQDWLCLLALFRLGSS